METKSDKLNDWGWVGGADSTVVDSVNPAEGRMFQLGVESGLSVMIEITRGKSQR